MQEHHHSGFTAYFPDKTIPQPLPYVTFDSSPPKVYRITSHCLVWLHADLHVQNTKLMKLLCSNIISVCIMSPFMQCPVVVKGDK